jgi:FAD/FMN-containing dehydrogenase
MDIAFNDVELKLMSNIKKVFDPKNIMNPSKIF